jgi:hypothetical protein
MESKKHVAEALSESHARFRVFLVVVLDRGFTDVSADFLGRPRGRFGSRSFRVSA